MGLKCLICSSSMGFFFSKPYHAFGLDTIDYWRCENCGFVISKTHVEMSPSAWERINYEWHASYQGQESDGGDPKWILRLRNQALVLHDLQQKGLLNRDERWLDYACGDGKLSAMLRSEHGLDLLRYERYMPRKDGYLAEEDLVPGTFGLVITTSIFEHLMRREQFDAIESLVGRNGVQGIHTLVCESVPADPTWFYMNPAHCTFHTNKSMEILFRQWNYTCSVYNVEAQLWLWFKDNPRDVGAAIQQANARPQGPCYVFKEGFVDYWKSSPLHRIPGKALSSGLQAAPGTDRQDRQAL